MEAIDITDYDWVLPADRKLKKEKQTIFILSTLDFDQDTYVENEISRNVPDGDIAAKILHLGLKGVRNFNLNGVPVKAERVKGTADNKDLMLPGDVMPWKSSFLSTISVNDRNALQLQIRFGKRIKEKEAKNS